MYTFYRGCPVTTLPAYTSCDPQIVTYTIYISLFAITAATEDMQT